MATILNFRQKMAKLKIACISLTVRDTAISVKFLTQRVTWLGNLPDLGKDQQLLPLATPVASNNSAKNNTQLDRLNYGCNGLKIFSICTSICKSNKHDHFRC